MVFVSYQQDMSGVKKSNLKANTTNQPKPIPNRPFVASHYVRPGLTEKQVIEAKQGFDLFDLGKTGYVEALALKDAMVSLGFGGKGSLMPQMIMDIADGNRTGLISFEDFLFVLTAKVSDFTTEQQWDRIFRAFDVDKNGSFNYKTLKAIIHEVGEDWDDAIIKDMFEKADNDKDGLIRSDEFFQVLTKKKN